VQRHFTLVRNGAAIELGAAGCISVRSTGQRELLQWPGLENSFVLSLVFTSSVLSLSLKFSLRDLALSLPLSQPLETGCLML
jgi:hypothetical protein